MFISDPDLNELATYTRAQGAISIYIYTPPDESLQGFRTRLHSFGDGIRKESAQFNNRDLTLLVRKFEELEQQFVDNHVEKKARTYCLFWSPDYFKLIEVPVKLKEQYRINQSFYIFPILGPLQQFERFAILVFNKKKARIYNYYLEKIKEDQYIEHDYVMPKTRPPDAYKDKVFLNKLDEEYNRHLKEVSISLFNYFKENKFDRLLIASQQDKINDIKPHLHSYLQQSLVGEFVADVNDTISIIQEKTEETVNTHRKTKEKNLLNQLNQDLGRRKAVYGAHDVVDALREKKIKEIYISPDFHISGYACPEEHFFSVDFIGEKKCAPDNSAMKKEQNLEEDIAQEAYQQNAKIVYIFYPDEEFSKHNIAATLRY